MRNLLTKLLICLCAIAIIVSCSKEPTKTEAQTKSEKPPKPEWIKVYKDLYVESFYNKNSITWHPITPTYGVFSVWVRSNFSPVAIEQMEGRYPGDRGIRYELSKMRIDCLLRKHATIRFQTLTEESKVLWDSENPPYPQAEKYRTYTFQEIEPGSLDDAICIEVCRICPKDTLRPYQPLSARGGPEAVGD